MRSEQIVFDVSACVRSLPGRCLLALVCIVAATSVARAESAPFVAGLQPDRRPEAAPRITGSAPSDSETETAVRGIDRPLPPLSFLKDHGGWYSPFTRPGMPGPYDIRGLHRPKESLAPTTTTSGPPPQNR